MVAAGEKGSGLAVIKRRDGSKEIVEKDSGKVIKEFDKSGRQRVRVDVRKGGGGGRSRRDQKTIEREAMKRREDRAKEALEAQEKAIAEGNFSTADGMIQRVSYSNLPSQTLDANFSSADGSIQKVTTSFSQASQPERKNNFFNRAADFYRRTKGFKTDEEKKNLTRAERFGNVIFGRTVPENVQGGAGALELISPAGGLKVVKTAKDVPRITRNLFKIKKGSDLARATRQTDRFIKSSVKAVAVGAGAPIVSREIGLFTSKDFKKQVVGTGANFRDVEKQLFKAGLESQKASFSNDKGLSIGKGTLTTRGLLTGISPLLTDKKGREAFREGVRVQALSLGLDPKQAEDFAIRQKRFRGGGEIVGVFGANVASEFAGTGFIAGSRLFQKGATTYTGNVARRKLFGTGFTQIGKAGFIEGVSTELAFSAGRSEKVTGKGLLLGGGFGFLSAGLLGGGIVSQQAGRKGVSRGLYTVGALLDPFEFPSDLTAGGLRKAGLAGKRTPIVGFSASDKGDFIIGRQPLIFTNSASFAKSPSNSLISTKRVSNTKVFSFSNIFNTGVSSNTRSSVGTFTDIFNIGSFTPSNTFNDGRGDGTVVQTSANTVSNIFTGTSVSIPRAQLPPPLFGLGFPPAGGPKTKGGKKGSKVVDELALAGNIFKKFVGRGKKGGVFF